MTPFLKKLTPIVVVLAAVLSMAQLNKVGVAQIVGTLGVSQGGTGITSAGGAGGVLRSTGSAWAASTTTWPNSATQGDLLTATGANAIGSVAAVASGQVLTSAGASTVPAYSANPSVTTVTVKPGTSTQTMKAGGLACVQTTSITDAATINQWNVSTCLLNANVLNAAGDTLMVKAPFTVAANANTKGYQIYWSLQSATCSGTGTQLCNSGCELGTNTTTSGSGASAGWEGLITKLSAGSHTVYEFLPASSSNQETNQTTCSLDETQATQIAIGVRNTSASAGSVTNSKIWVFAFSK